MQRVGRNWFKWPKQDDHLLTLREDILFKCTVPIMVSSSTRACRVGLPAIQAAQADAALDLVVYLQSFLFPNLNFVNLCSLFQFFSNFLVQIKTLTFIQITAKKLNSSNAS